jgi:hypothetical protein
LNVLATSVEISWRCDTQLTAAPNAERRPRTPALAGLSSRCPRGSAREDQHRLSQLWLRPPTICLAPRLAASAGHKGRCDQLPQRAFARAQPNTASCAECCAPVKCNAGATPDFKSLRAQATDKGVRVIKPAAAARLSSTSTGTASRRRLGYSRLARHLGVWPQSSPG